MAYRRDLKQRVRDRYLDVLASIYVYNEHRGYTSLDRVLEAVRKRCPDDLAFIAAVEKHRADERKHYLMFKRYYELEGRMPLAIGRTCGHIDHFISIMFGKPIDALDTDAIVADDALFEKLCRVIMLTEKRGMAQVDILLRSPLILSNTKLKAIFKVVERDEPSHWMPYEDWLARNHRRQPRWWEKLVDLRIHRELMLVRIPALFLNWRMGRMTRWPDSDDRIDLSQTGTAR
ncbi:ferritin-like domain-containing protein [Sphingobium sp. H33]|uniref:Ferritin-like domain-containing protein n=1 Tax=Sphingobium nicotianae TaxID=2782607 RepID=A0A9X1AI19_9SPHN|nr:ferritin-like domain-containing protein [Sphingobium nicotianae]